MNDLLQAALAYAAGGWYVFPLSPGTKIPPPGTRGHLDATADQAQIAAWWGASPNANIGIAVAPSALMVLDVDVSDAKQGAASLAQIDAQLTPTLTARTGRGGIHAVYARGDMPPERRIGVLPGIDIIGDGYIVAAPSRLAEGGAYAWIATPPIAPAPDVLRTLRRVAPVVAASDVGQVKIAEGGRNAAMFRLGAALRGTGIDREAIRAAMILENRRRFDPPLPDDEVEGLVGKVMRHARAERDAAYGAVLADEMRDLFPAPAGDLPDAATIEELVPQLEAESKLPVAHIPFQQLDDKIGGLSVHSTTLLIGGTGKGKSSLAGQIAVHHARNFGPSIYYVGEMTRSLVVARVAGQVLGRSWIDVVRGRVPWAEVARALRDLPMLFVKRSDTPMQAIAAACSRTVQLNWPGIPMIVADYVQIMASIGQDMRLGVAGTVRDLQRFVETAPVIALELSQTSRAGAKSLRDGVASAEDGQGKGAETSELENGATNTLTISYASKDGASVHDVTILLGKGRFGGGDKFGFKFHGATGLWEATDKPPVDEGHEGRCAEILSHLMVHDGGRCMGGSQPCGRDLSVATMSVKGPHRVAGTRDQIARAVEDLIDMRRVLRLGNTLTAVQK
jgi:hypothetical protein